MSQEQATPKASSVVILNLAEAKRPVFRETRGRAYVKYGDDNLYPLYLLERFEKATKHGAIVAGKTDYIIGKGWKVKDGEDPRGEAWIANCNRYGESLTEVARKCALDRGIHGGYYVQVIWGLASKCIAEIYHIDFTRVRSNKDNTQFIYRENWRIGDRLYLDAFVEKVFPAFNPANPYGSQIFFFKEYSPGSRTYPVPEYMRGLNYVLAEEEVGKHTLGNASTGFTPSTSITYTNGEPPDDEKKKITKKYEDRFTGADGKKFILHFVNGSEQKPIFDALGPSDLTKEDFTAVDNLISGNLYSGHQITTPALFGIATPGALGQRTELEVGYAIFNNTYVKGKQQQLAEVFNKLSGHAGVTVELELIPTDPIGVDLDKVKDFAPKSWLLEQIGVDPAKYPDAQVGTAQQPVNATSAPVNEALQKLTGRQHQQLFRVIRQYGQGKITKDQAKVMLGTGYGLTPDEINQMLGESEAVLAQTAMLAMAATEQEWDMDNVISVFAEYGSDPAGYTVLKTRKLKYSDDEVDNEIKEHTYFSFASGQLSELQSSVLDLISKDKRITPEVMANTLAVDLSDINTALAGLEKAGAIAVSGKAGEEVRTLTKPLGELQDGVKAKTKQFRVMYSYDGPQDSRNRPFCAKMMELGRYYTRAEIELISARLGYSVWDRRGGFYHNPKTQETTPYCRHSWMSHIVMENK